MNWTCQKCGNKNEEVSGICTSCFEIRSVEAVGEKSSEEIISERFQQVPPKGVWSRIFSVSERLSRRDFLGCTIALLVLYFLTLVAVAIAFPSQIEVANRLLMLIFFGPVSLLASKRCRDLGANPWWGIPAVLLTLGLIVLIFSPGTDGANRYGPKPYAGKQAPNKSLDPTTTAVTTPAGQESRHQ